MVRALARHHHLSPHATTLVFTTTTSSFRRVLWLLLPLLLLMLGQIFNRTRHLLLPKKPLVPVEPTTDFAQQAKRAMSSATNGDSAELGVATVASGCFWGTEHIYREHYGKGKGLLDAKVGFIGGKESSKDPSYQEVCSGRTGHAEATQIKYDPVSLDETSVRAVRSDSYSSYSLSYRTPN